MHIHQQLETVLLILVFVVRIGDDTHITYLSGFGLNTLDDMGIMVKRHIGHHNTYDTGCIVTQTHGKGIGTVASLLSKTKNFLT